MLPSSMLSSFLTCQFVCALASDVLTTAMLVLPQFAPVSPLMHQAGRLAHQHGCGLLGEVCL